MAWSLAESLAACRQQANVLYPARSKRSDGTIGDPAHAARRSDHNPCADHSIVHALDLTHDPGAGFDVHAWARRLAAHGDPRVKYLISNGQIWNPPGTAWATYARLRAEGHSRLEAAGESLPGWRPYYGSNPHRAHVHVSVKHSDVARADTSPWFYDDAGQPTTPPQQEDEVAYRYSINGQVWTTNLVWRQHWESPGPGLGIVLTLATDLGTVPQDFHDSLEDITEAANKARDAVNYGVENQKAIVALTAKVDALLARPSG